MPAQVGQKAPDFTLFNTEKKEISLKDYRGKNVVLLFFPFAFSSGCTKELCTARDNSFFYNDADAEVIAISTDSIFALKKFKEELSLDFPLLSDYNKTVSPAYDSLYETWGFHYKGVCKRASFVIDGEGIIRHAEILLSADMHPDFNAIEESLKKLKSV